jgi:hypothetical protein
MYGISPEDRLWMVNRDQAERRQLAATDRIAATERRTSRTLVRHPWTAVSHALHALSHVRLHVPTHGTAH